MEAAVVGVWHEAAERPGEIGAGIDAEELARLDQGEDGADASGAADHPGQGRWQREYPGVGRHHLGPHPEPPAVQGLRRAIPR